MPASELNAEVTVMLGLLYIFVYNFLLIKIVKQGQLYQQLVKPIIHICFSFFAHKNDSAEATILAVGLKMGAITVINPLYIPIFVFQLIKMITQELLCLQLIRLVVPIYFCFFTYTAAKTLLSNTFLTVFAFLIAKIVIQRQQLCQANYMYLFLLFYL